MGTMNTITSTLSGLASSFLLNAGLAHIAEKFDPVSSRPTDMSAEAHGPALSYPSTFTVKPRRS